LSSDLSYIIFTDFDGTISVSDIGDEMFEHFGDVNVCYKSFQAYQDGKINARECWRQGFASVPSVTKEEFTSFALRYEIDKNFPLFVEFCTSRDIPVMVVSDGFDAYIEPVLKKEHLGWIPRFSNSMQFNDDGTIEPVFPFTDAQCEQCANCKRNHILTVAGDNHVIVYVGDGYSDRCPAQFADIVFAKDALVSYCETHNITFHRFSSFKDVLEKFRTIVEKGKPRKRRTAELARKDVFMTE
jgi:2-hydroxy-3-keto-5-methylthiopentenyl-1-phosphate phosphatase